MVYILTIIAALIVGLGTVVEQRAASQAPPEYNLSVKLLWWLVRNRLWLLGVGCSLVGNIVFASALGSGNVALVEAVYLLRLLFALAIATVWRRRRPGGRDIAGALAISAGLIAFILATRPTEGTGGGVPAFAWVISGGVIVAFAIAAAVVASRLGPLHKALLLGIGGGSLFGLQASLTHTAVQTLTQAGVLGLLLSWQGYAVIAVAFLGMLLVQSAYEAAPLSASYPTIVTGQLLVGMALGVWLLGGQIQGGVSGLAVGGFALVVMIAGVYLLTTSPLLTGELDQLVRRQDVGRATQIESRMRSELRRAEQAASRAESHLASTPGRREERILRSELTRIEAGLERLCKLQEDIRSHRQDERRRLDEQATGEQEASAERERELLDKERSIDEYGRQLRQAADRLAARRDFRNSAGPNPRSGSGQGG